MATKTKEVYCTTCRQVQTHELNVDGNAEIKCTCTICEHFFKIAAGTSLEDVRQEINTREERHAGLMTAEEEEALHQESETILDEL